MNPRRRLHAAKTIFQNVADLARRGNGQPRRGNRVGATIPSKLNSETEVVEQAEVAKTVFLTSRNRPRYPPKEEIGFRKPRAVWWILVIALEVIFIVGAVVVTACAASISSFRRKTLWSFPIWELALTCGITVASRLIACYLVRIIGVVIRWIFRSMQLTVYVLHGLQHAAWVWMTMVFIITPWFIILSNKATKEQKVVLLVLLQVITAVLIISTLWFTKAIITTCCSAWFHLTTYQERIEESLFSWYVIEALSGHPWSKIRHLFDPKRTSAWDMKKIIMDQKHIGIGVKIRDESEAETAAKTIF
ncbi:Hypothetical Protein [Arabidopsis thaliana]|uniref:F13F21.29 protein n=2 Tax=Arabidopsis thaliana TaxID=3702 RepID=Q9XI95_ARATH|nr:Hypothetical Protein [Arabidopsis thaliana]